MEKGTAFGAPERAAGGFIVRCSLSDATELLANLRYFRQQVDRPLWLVWDHLNVHQAPPVRCIVATRPDDVALTWISAYAPGLNPRKLCNQSVKEDTLHALPDSVDDLHQLVRERVRRLPKQPDVLKHFFVYARLRVSCRD